jgi:hypothetical protein
VNREDRDSCVRTLLGATVVAMVAVVLVSGGWAALTPPDRRPPSRPTIDGPKQPTILRPVFTFGATDNRTPRGKVRFRCAFDGSPLRPCARIHRPNDRLSFGGHTLRVRAFDLPGNGSRVASFSFRVVGSWDAAADFERAPRPANPGRDRYGNTSWFYLYGGRTHDPATYQLLPTFWVRPDWELWVLLPDFQSALVGFNNGQMLLHPGASQPGQNAILGWRSPLGGTVRVQAAISVVGPPCPVPANGISWSLDKGAETVRSGLLDPGGINNVEQTLTIAAAESLYLIVDDRQDSNCDSTLVRLIIETTPG